MKHKSYFVAFYKFSVTDENMRIKKVQIEKETEIIVKAFLQDGIYPSFRLIRSHLSKRLMTYKLGKPKFKYKAVQNKTNVPQLNSQFNDIEQDLVTAFEATILQKNAIVTHFSEGEIIRQRIENQLRKVNKRMNKLLVETGSRNRYLQTETISFEDMQSVNMNETDAFIDAREGSLKLNEQNALSRKIVLLNHQINVSVQTPYTKMIEHGYKANMINDNLNEAWMAEILTNQLNDQQEMTVSITISKTEPFNRLHIVPHHVGDVMIRVFYEVQDGAYRPLGDEDVYTSGDNIFINTELIETPSIKIELTKRGFDDNVPKGYRFYLGIRNISMEAIAYEPKSEAYLTPLLVPDGAMQVSGRLEAKVNNETAAHMYMAIHDKQEADVSKLQWQQVYTTTTPSPSQTLIEISTKIEERESARRTVPYGEKGADIPLNKLVRASGESLFAKEYLGEIEDPRLYRGVGQWKSEAIYTPFTGEIPIKATWESKKKDKKSSVVISYQHRGNDLHYTNTNVNFYKFSICLYGKREEKLPIALLNIVGVYSLYVNQERIVTSNNEALCLFKEGWNELDIYIHIGDIRKRADLKPEETPYGFSIGKLDILYFLTQRAELQPMKYVTKDNLQYNVNLLDDDAYTIIDKEILLVSPVKDIEHQLVYSTKKDTEQKYLHVKIVTERKGKRHDVTPHIKNATINYI